MDDRLVRDQVDLESAFAVPRTTSPTEEEAIRRLALLDLPGARAAIDSVLREVLGQTPSHSHASYLLYDILSRAERVVADHQGLAQRGFTERLATVRRLAAARSAEDLSWVFWSAYEAITRPLTTQALPGPPAIEEVKAYVLKHFTRKLALAEIARAVGVSRNYLSHLFKRHSGVTVTEFIHRTRMRQAETLLLDGGMTVSEIAYLVGYQNYRDFHRNFVKYEKTSPKKFRQFRTTSRNPSAVYPP